MYGSYKYRYFRAYCQFERKPESVRKVQVCGISGREGTMRTKFLILIAAIFMALSLIHI